MTDIARLLERLEAMRDSGRRALGGDGRAGITSMMWVGKPIIELANPDGPEAARVIRDLVAALRPFAREAARWDSIPGVHYHDSVELWQSGQTKVSVGDLRRARTILEGLRDEG